MRVDSKGKKCNAGFIGGEKKRNLTWKRNTGEKIIGRESETYYLKGGVLNRASKESGEERRLDGGRGKGILLERLEDYQGAQRVSFKLLRHREERLAQIRGA